MVIAGATSNVKEGTRVPIITGSTQEGSTTSNTQVQYVDVGLHIEASLDGSRLHTKVDQSSVADEKSGTGVQDPVIRQTALETSSALEQDKPLKLGGMDVPGSTRRLEVEVASEVVK